MLVGQARPWTTRGRGLFLPRSLCQERFGSRTMRELRAELARSMQD